MSDEIRQVIEQATAADEAARMALAALRAVLSAPDADTAKLLSALPEAAAVDDAEALTILQDAAAPAPVLPEPLTGAGWEREPADREWLVDGWLPAGELSLLAGPGSVGKSLLALQLGAALACDRAALLAGGDWLPAGARIAATAPALAPAPCPVVLAGWEDSADEALRRRGRLAMHGGCTWARHGSIDARLHVLPMRGHGPLWAPAEGGSRHIGTVGALTASGEAVLAYAEQHGARLLVLDPAGLAIATNENDRALVSMALDKLAGWATDNGCAVLVTGHPAKATEGESAEYSGSTAWRGSVRALWTLRAPTDKQADRNSAEWSRLVGHDPARAERVALLARNKSNYGWDGDALTLATAGARAGWYLTDPVPTPAPADKANGARKAGGKANGAGKAVDLGGYQ